MRPITLTTDFGSRDGYVAAMKGVCYSAAPGAMIVDITHEIPPQNLRAAAWVCGSALPYFPPHSVHVIVVDPTVGSDRRPLVAEYRSGFVICPDNGLLGLLTRFMHLGAIREISVDEPVSATFHGRDVFCPCAVRLAKGGRFEEVGPRVIDPVSASFDHPVFTSNGCRCDVVHIDGFGNIILSLHRDDAFKPTLVSVAGRNIPMKRIYADVAKGEMVALWGSTGFLELAMRDGNATLELGLKPGDQVEVQSS
ncbi:MAG: SAM-dependent chlorinase/fluorinase [Acidobacteria bacterium]|nr:SAM-dependent chlorinase/fluorinase [Acidobacteriota bacterium]